MACWLRAVLRVFGWEVSPVEQAEEAPQAPLHRCSFKSRRTCTISKMHAGLVAVQSGRTAAMLQVLAMERSTATRRFDRGNVDLLHAHHRTERAPCLLAAGRERLGQYTRRDLPGDAPLVFAPAARALLATIADDGIPVAVCLLLIVGSDLE